VPNIIPPYSVISFDFKVRPLIIKEAERDLGSENDYKQKSLEIQNREGLFYAKVASDNKVA
jgi:hypothetical protein